MIQHCKSLVVLIFIFVLLQIVKSEELQIHQRTLGNLVTDGSKSVATVSGNKKVDVLLQAKDELGNNITIGGDNFLIEIKNECIMDRLGNCITVSGAAVVMNPEIKSAMTDNLNGTYSYSFTPTSNGKISVLVYLYDTTNGVYVEIWNNTNLSGAIDKTTKYPNIFNVWTSGYLTSTYSVLCSGRYTTTLTVPQNDTYTIYYYHDDGGRLYLNGILKIDHWFSSVATNSFSIQLNTLTKYSLLVEFMDIGTIGATKLWWSYTGQPQIQIPNSAYSSIRYTASSPIALNVILLCGNGVKNSYEECDDGNTQNYDGCNSSCTIEANYTCTGGTLTSADVCTSTLSSSETISSFSRTFSLITTGLIAAGLLINTIAVLTSGYSSGSMFTMINQIQLIMLLPMLPNFMNEDVRVFIVSFNFCLFNFKFIGLDPKDISIGLQLDYEQPDKYLKEIKMNSGSGIINIQSNLCGVALMILLQISLLICSYLLRKWKVDNCLSKFINKAYANMAFGWYIQYIICSYLMILLASISEIFRFDTSSSSRIISLSISFAILTSCIAFVCFASFKWYQSNIPEKLESMKYTNKLFENTKNSKAARFNIIRVLSQILCFCIVATVTIKSTIIYLKLSIFSLIELVSVIFVIFIRPYCNLKENMIVIINDIFYFILLMLLFYLNNESNWTEFFKFAYSSIVILNNIVILIVSLIFSIREHWQRIQNCIKSLNLNKVQAENQVTVYDNSVISKTVDRRDESEIDNRLNPSALGINPTIHQADSDFKNQSKVNRKHKEKKLESATSVKRGFIFEESKRPVSIYGANEVEL